MGQTLSTTAHDGADELDSSDKVPETAIASLSDAEESPYSRSDWPHSSPPGRPTMKQESLEMDYFNTGVENVHIKIEDESDGPEAAQPATTDERLPAEQTKKTIIHRILWHARNSSQWSRRQRRTFQKLFARNTVRAQQVNSNADALAISSNTVLPVFPVLSETVAMQSPVQFVQSLPDPMPLSTGFVQPRTDYSQHSTTHVQPFIKEEQSPPVRSALPPYHHMQPFIKEEEDRPNDHIQPAIDISRSVIKQESAAGIDYVQGTGNNIQPAENYLQVVQDYIQAAQCCKQAAQNYNQAAETDIQTVTEYKSDLPSAENKSSRRKQERSVALRMRQSGRRSNTGCKRCGNRHRDACRMTHCTTCLTYHWPQWRCLPADPSHQSGQPNVQAGVTAYSYGGQKNDQYHQVTTTDRQHPIVQELPPLCSFCGQLYHPSSPCQTSATYAAPSYAASPYAAAPYSASTYTAPSYTAPSYIAPTYTAPSYAALSYTAPYYAAPSYVALSSYSSAVSLPAPPKTHQYNFHFANTGHVWQSGWAPGAAAPRPSFSFSVPPTNENCE